MFGDRFPLRPLGAVVGAGHVPLAVGGHAEQVPDPVSGPDPGDHDVGPLAQVPAVTPPVRDRGPAVFADDVRSSRSRRHVEVAEDQGAGDHLAGVGGDDGRGGDCVHGGVSFCRGFGGRGAVGDRPASPLPPLFFGCWRSLRSCGRRRPVHPQGKGCAICAGNQRRRSAGARLCGPQAPTKEGLDGPERTRTIRRTAAKKRRRQTGPGCPEPCDGAHWTQQPAAPADARKHCPWTRGARPTCGQAVAGWGPLWTGGCGALLTPNGC